MWYPLFMQLFVSEGNPAAVCPLPFDIPDPLKQTVALEMNLSETAYVQPKDKRDLGGDVDKFYR